MAEGADHEASRPSPVSATAVSISIPASDQVRVRCWCYHNTGAPSSLCQELCSPISSSGTGELCAMLLPQDIAAAGAGQWAALQADLPHVRALADMITARLTPRTTAASRMEACVMRADQLGLTVLPFVVPPAATCAARCVHLAAQRSAAVHVSVVWLPVVEDEGHASAAVLAGRTGRVEQRTGQLRRVACCWCSG